MPVIFDTAMAEDRCTDMPLSDSSHPGMGIYLERLFGQNLKTRQIRRTWAKFANLTNMKSKAWMAMGLLHLGLLRFRRVQKDPGTAQLDIAVVPIGRTDLDGETACRLANAFDEAGARVALIHELYTGMGRNHPYDRDPSEADALSGIQQNIPRRALPFDKRPSYFSPEVTGLWMRTKRILGSYIFPLNRWLLQVRPGLLVFMTDAHYAARYLCLAATVLGIPTVRLQMNGGANDVHQDDTPYYPLFADAMLVWSDLYVRTHMGNYPFKPPAHFIPAGSPKYDRLILAHRQAAQTTAAKPHLLVISNTQFYRRHSRQCGNPAYVYFADFVIALLERQEREGIQVTLKLHPRESLADLYRTRPKWKHAYEKFVVRDADLNACIQDASGVILMASGVITDCLLQKTPLMVLDIGGGDAGHAGKTIWDAQSPLVSSGAVCLAKSVRQAENWVDEMVAGRRLISDENANRIIEMMFANPGCAAETIAGAMWHCMRTLPRATP